jgi:hypothetical protein
MRAALVGGLIVAATIGVVASIVLPIAFLLGFGRQAAQSLGVKAKTSSPPKQTGRTPKPNRYSKNRSAADLPRHPGPVACSPGYLATPEAGRSYEKTLARSRKSLTTGTPACGFIR